MPSDFGRSFKGAKSKGVAEFSWNGKPYSTMSSGEKEKLLQLAPSSKLWDKMSDDPSLRYVSQYNTGLSKPELEEFKQWAKKQYGSLDEALYEMGAYDLQGAWKAMKGKEIDYDPNTGHLPDTYKKPNHITFSDESRYHNAKDMQGGTWTEVNGRWKFKPAKGTIDLYGKEQLQRYFQEYEPDADLEF
jgi:hypothetical protein